MNYKVRNVEERDLEAIQEIEDKSFLYPFSKRQFLNLYINCKKTFFVAESDRKLLGYIVGVRSFRKITIASIAVKKNFRRRGIATELVRHLIKKVREKVKRIELQVRVSNEDAIMFYEKIGFLFESILPSYYQNGEDAVLYSKDL
jgi:ribosomal-protein-alanine N-acetyltransferase